MEYNDPMPSGAEQELTPLEHAANYLLQMMQAEPNVNTAFNVLATLTAIALEGNAIPVKKRFIAYLAEITGVREAMQKVRDAIDLTRWHPDADDAGKAN